MWMRLQTFTAFSRPQKDFGAPYHNKLKGLLAPFFFVCSWEQSLLQLMLDCCFFTCYFILWIVDQPLRNLRLLMQALVAVDSRMPIQPVSGEWSSQIPFLCVR
jgi:hypothetical protein